MLTRSQLRSCQEVLLAWNIAFVLVFTLFLRHGKLLNNDGSFSDEGYSFYYAFFRGAVRANDLLHLHSSNPAFGPLPNPGSQVGSELMFVFSILCLAIPLFVTLRLLSRMRLPRLVLIPFAGVLAIFAIPFFYLYGVSQGLHLAIIPFYDLYSPWSLFFTFPLSILLSLLFWKARPDA